MFNRSKRKSNHHAAGVFDEDRQLFLLNGQNPDPRTFKSFADWRDANSECIAWLDCQLDHPERSKRGYVLKSTVESLIDSFGPAVKTDRYFRLNTKITTLIMRHMVWREHHLGKPHRHLFEFRRSPKSTTCPQPDCKHRNRATALFCDRCGEVILKLPGTPNAAGKGVQ